MTKINQEEYKFLKGLNDYWKWKWIARDSDGNHGGNLFAYSEKPYKDCYTKDWRVSSLEWFNIDNRLFQFVQWEDSEPYSIAWLLGEYEEAEYGYFNNELYERFYEESEEAEVKKDIDWAIQEIEGLETEPSQNYPHDKMIEREIVLGILSQLDEQETLSEYWIEQKSIDTHVDTLSGEIQVTFRMDDLQSIIVPKQEEMKVPKMWHDVIVQNREDGHSLRWTLNYIDDLNVNDVDSFARAWIAYPNIEVKEEQKYYIDLETAAYVAKWDGNGQVDIYTDGISGSDEYELHLTEKEIKDFDPRFWPFRKPVEELEE